MVDTPGTVPGQCVQQNQLLLHSTVKHPHSFSQRSAPAKQFRPAGFRTRFTIESGEYRAAVASVGASLRSLTHGGRNLVVPFDEGEVRPGYRGANLVLWPNRIAGGSYMFNGATEQLDINEAGRMTALHGLTIWNDWTVQEQTESGGHSWRRTTTSSQAAARRTPERTGSAWRRANSARRTG